MCGISLLLESSDESSNQGYLNCYKAQLERLLRRRGPDGFDSCQVNFDRKGDESSVGRCKATLYAAVLHIQGNEMASQPLTEEGNILCWNGEVFGGIELESHESDTYKVLELLNSSVSFSNLSDSVEGVSSFDLAIVTSLSKIWGPYAFIFYCSNNHTIYYGRDPFGRRSLLHYKGTNGITAVSSMAISDTNDIESISQLQEPDSTKNEIENDENDYVDMNKLGWEEVSTDGIFKLSLCDSYGAFEYSVIPWPENRMKLTREVLQDIPRNKNDIMNMLQSSRFDHCSGIRAIDLSLERHLLAKAFVCTLKSAILRRINRLEYVYNNHNENDQNHCNIGVLFSGGIDSVLLANVLGLCLTECTVHQELESLSSKMNIDLINISFYDDKDSKTTRKSDKNPPMYNLNPSPDRLAAIAAAADIQTLYPMFQWNLVHIDVSSTIRIDKESHIKRLIYPSSTHMDLNIGTAFWFATSSDISHQTSEDVVHPYSYTRMYASDEINNVFNTTHVGTSRPLLRVGNDSATLAVGRKGHSSYSNVSTKKDKSASQNSSKSKLICANHEITNCLLHAKEECVWKLCKKCCIGKQRAAIASNDTTACCDTHKLRNGHEDKNKSSHALNIENENECISATTETNSFANNSNCIPYQSRCKVYLVGIGADEQMAGYGRHRTVFERNGIHALENELNMDTKRLWKRNLGRDDRCISDNGVEAWFPFIDEELVSLLHSLPIDMICDLNDGQGSGDKRILRDAAALLGIRSECHQLVKRAIQFGTNIAKQTNNFYHGSNRKGKGTTKI